MSVQKRRAKAIARRVNVARLACKWDQILGRERGCHIDAARLPYVCAHHGGAA